MRIDVINDPGDLFEKVGLPDVRRLNLQPGDHLAAILPANVATMQAMADYAKQAQAVLDEYAPDVRALVFPHGTELNVIREQG